MKTFCRKVAKNKKSSFTFRQNDFKYSQLIMKPGSFSLCDLVSTLSLTCVSFSLVVTLGSDRHACLSLSPGDVAQVVR